MISPNDTSSRESLSDAQRRAAMVRRVIEDCMVRRSSGNRLTDEEITSSHADLMPELGEELALLSVMERARWAAGSNTHDATLDAGSRGTASTDIAALLSFRGYDLDREIHRGGQGVVYKAVQRSTQRPIAIKVLHESQIADRRDAARFEREARILGLLNHPNVVKIHDTGIIAGRRYLAMDLIDGKPWDRHEGAAGEACRDIRAAADRFAAICDAVNAAHLRGIIHRDLKPGNVLIDESGIPHVLDFGLAKLTEASSTDTVSMTAEGQFIGSLPWASPEQAAGQSELLDVRSDVYSLGVMFYQVLTGAFPYNIKGPWRTVADTILQTEPSKPRTHRPELDIDLERIVLKCLAKDTAQRYQSAGELAADVRRYLAGEPVMARGGSTFYVLARLARKHRMAVAGAAAFLILLGGSAVVTTLLYQRERTALTDATAARKKAEAETSKAKAVLGFLQDMMSAADPNRNGKDVKVVELLDRASAALPNTETLKDKPLIEAAVRQTMAETYHGLGLPERAVDEFKRAIELQEANEETVSKDRIINMHALGTSLLTLGRLDDAQRIVEEAMSLLGVTKTAEISDEPTAELMGLYNLILGSRGQFQDMIPNARRRQAFYDRTYGRENWRTVYAMNDLSVALARNDKFHEMADLCREARELAIAAFGPDAPITLTISMNLSTALRELGEKDEAKELIQHVLESQRRILPPDHPSIAGTLSQYAHICGAVGDVEGAIMALEEALDIQIRSMGEGSFRVAETRLSLSSIYVHQKEFDKAQELLELAFDSVKPTWCEHPTFERMLQEAILELQHMRNLPAKVKDWENQFDALRCDPAEPSLAE